jgi:hypothetical protein
MKKASTLEVSAILRKLTALQPVKDNDTRWSSVFPMTTCFFCIQKEMSAIKDLLQLLPTLVEVNVLEKCYVHLKKFHDIASCFRRRKSLSSRFEKYLIPSWLPMQK